MKTKAEVYKECKARVKKAYASYERAHKAVLKAKAKEKITIAVLDAAHAVHCHKTGLGYMEKERNQAYAKRMGPKEMERQKHLTECHLLANSLFVIYPQLGLGGCQSAAWAHLGWNADCSKRVKPKAGDFVATCPHCHKPNIFNVTKEEMEQDYDMTCDNDKCIKQSRISQYERVV